MQPSPLLCTHLRRLLAPLLLLLALVLSSSGRAQEQAITIGDRLMLTVVGEADLTGTFIVDQDGNVVLPLVEKVPAGGKTLPQFRADLVMRLARYIKEPQVRVDFAQRAQITVGFTGLVKKPGPVTLPKGSRLLDGLAQASGLMVPDADESRVRLQRRGEPAPRVLDLRGLAKDAATNIELLDGDQVDVPAIPMNAIRVLGAVNKPGEFKHRERVPLLEALAMAGGIAQDADRGRLQLLRRNAAQPEVVSLDDVLTGKSVLLLQDGDTLSVLTTPRIGVKVFGLVSKPGELQVKEGATLLEAVTSAGGFKPEADKSAILVTLPNGQLRKADLSQVDGPDGAMKLADGTQVHIPEQALLRYAVAGAVNEPGTFAIPQDPKQKVYLSDALAQAKGPIDRAKKKTIALVRKSPNGGQPTIQQINFKAYLEKKDPNANPEILPNDVVYVDSVPEGDRRSSLLERVLGIAAGFFF